jgi:hypothetical protein
VESKEQWAAAFPYLSPNRKKVEKSIAMNSASDIFLALRRP